MKIIRALVAVSLMTGIVPASAADRGELVEMIHWIEVDTPPGFAVERRKYKLTQTEKGVRTPLQITFTRLKLRMSRPHRNVRETASGSVRWTMRKCQAAGSGGAIWHLTIVHPLATIFAQKQRELGQPDFARVWQIVDTVRPAPRD